MSILVHIFVYICIYVCDITQDQNHQTIQYTYVQFEKILDSFPSVFYPAFLTKDILSFSNLWTVDFIRSGKRSIVFLFFFNAFIFLIYFIFKLYIIVLVLPNIKMNPPQVYMCSPSSNITFEVFYLLSENPVICILECLTVFIIFLSSLL